MKKIILFILSIVLLMCTIALYSQQYYYMSGTLTVLLLGYTYFIYKMFSDRLPFKFKIIKSPGMMFVETLPEKLVYQFKKYFKNMKNNNEYIVPEDKFDEFILKMLSPNESESYFIKKHKKTTDILSKIAKTYSNQTQYAFIPYYDKNNQIQVLTEFEGKKINIQMKKSFLNFMSETNRHDSKIRLSDIKNWFQTINNN